MVKNLKTERFEAHVEPEVRSIIVEAAEIAGQSVSEFIVSSAKDRAEKLLRRQTIIRLTAEDQARFADAILNPPPPNEAMEQARELHGTMIETDST